MAYTKVTPEILSSLKKITGDEFVINDEYNLEIYSKDYTEDFRFPPEVIVKPETPEHISEIIKLANQFKIPVYPRGGGTGLSGGALPVLGGICLSMER